MEFTINEKNLTRASSGNIEKLFHGSSSYGYYLGIDWKVNSQSTTSNSSNVTATVYIRTTGSGVSISSSASKDVSITINGTKYLSTCTVGIGTNSKKNLLSKTVTVSHNSDGTKTCAFACALDINVTLSGTYYGKVSHSGNGTFNTINLNSAPTMSGSVSVSPSGTIPENQSSLRVSWNKASDAQNNATSYQVYRYVNGGHNATFDVNNINQTYIDDNISGFGQGTQIYYKVWARDSYGLWSNEISSSTVTKNRFTGAWFTGHSNDVAWNTTQFTLNFGGASNTNGNTSFNYRIYSDDVTIHNQRDITTTSETVKIWKTGETVPTTPYIKFDDLKNKFRGSSFNGRLHVGVRTTNAYGTQAWSGGSIGVDLRTTPTKPDSVTISGGTALKTITTTGNKYYIPNGTDTIVFNWTGGADKIGESHQYRIYQILDGVATVIATVSGSTKSHTVTLPKQSSTKTLAFGVHTLTSYGYTDFRDSGAVTLHYYNPPTVDVIKIDRTDTTATAKIKLNANTSIPNVNFPTRSYSGASSGTLTNTREEQSITASNLSGGSKYTWTVTVKDDTGLHSANVTKTIEIPAYTPLFSVREKGVGINVIPDGTAKLMVKGGANITGGLTVDGKQITGDVDTSNLLKKSDLASASNYKGKVANIGTDGVMEVGKYIDMHDGSTNDYDVRLQCTGTKLEVKGAMAVDRQLEIRDYISLPNNSNSWLGGATAGNIRGYKQTTGSFHPIISQTTASNHKIAMGGLDNVFGFYLYDANRTTNGFDKEFTFNLANKNLYTSCRTIFNEWVYVQGNYGLYFPDHNGGWFMQDSTWLRSYADKSIYTGGSVKADTQVQTKKIEFANNDNITYDDTNNIFNFTADDSVNNSKIRAGHLWSGSASGAECKIYANWSGSQGTEFCMYNNKGNGWGYIGNSGVTWYRVYGAGGSVSDRKRKYDITRADVTEHYENVKGLNLYNYRSISDEQDENGNTIKEFKRQDLVLGCMVDELPTETVFYDNESGDGKAVDMYSYTSMVLGATKHLIEKVETLEKENELKDKKIEDLEQRLEKMEELLNGIINKG